MQTRDVRVLRELVPLFIQLLRSLSTEEAQLISQRLLAIHPLQDGDVLRLLAHINIFVPGAINVLLFKEPGGQSL
jgi:hypothetical protein